MDGVGMLAAGVGHVPQRPDHAPDTARPEYLDERETSVGRGGVVRYGFGDTENVAEKGEDAHGVIRCSTIRKR